MGFAVSHDARELAVVVLGKRSLNGPIVGDPDMIPADAVPLELPAVFKNFHSPHCRLSRLLLLLMISCLINLPILEFRQIFE